jgi:hypothetical protein
MDFSFQFADLSYKFLEDAFKVLSANQIGRPNFKFIFSTVDTYYRAVIHHPASKTFP